MLEHLTEYIAYTRKAIINLTGLVASLLALGLLNEPYAGFGAGALAVLTVLSHFFTPNASAPGTAPAVEEFGEEEYEPKHDDEVEELNPTP